MANLRKYAKRRASQFSPKADAQLVHLEHASGRSMSEIIRIFVEGGLAMQIPIPQKDNPDVVERTKTA